MAGPLQRAVLELDADVDPNTSGKETGVFEMVGNLEIQQSGETDYLMASGQGSTINAIYSGYRDAVSDLDAGARDHEVTNRAGFFLDLGGGKHTIQLNFTGWEGAQDSNGNDLQWGNTGDASAVTTGDATGADPLTQMHVFIQYWRIGEYDSRAKHARLRFGEYRDGTYASADGMYGDYLQVTIPRFNVTRVSDDPIAFDGSISCVEAANWSDPLDAYGQVEW